MSRCAALLLTAACGAALAGDAPAARAIAAADSEIGFTVRQMGVGVSGVFRRFSGAVQLDPAHPEAGSAALDVDVASLDTGNEEADAIARSKPWLDAAGFPRATFRSSAVRARGANRYEIKGVLTLKGKPREITVPVSLEPGAGGRLRVRGEFVLRRTQFGVGGGEWNDADLVADEVPVEFSLMLAPPR